MEGLEEISRRLCRSLNSIGYDEFMVKFRRQKRHELFAILGEASEEHKVIGAGSEGEGISKCFESDSDELLLLKNIFCVIHASTVCMYPENTTVFKIKNTHSGYCTLELLRKGTHRFTQIENSLVPYKHSSFLSSIVLQNEIANLFPSNSAGPAHKMIDQAGLETDIVFTLESECQGFLQEWSTRQRNHEWPPVDLRQRIVRMTGNLVAKGMEGSETNHLEWRLCFNEIELLLLESFNDTQIKLYKMLKLINSDILKPVGFNITSYIVKNIVFWLAEVYPLPTFRQENLIKWIFKALLMLKQATKLNYIPYYMIPERNLLKEKVSELERKPLHDYLTVLIKMGPEVLLHCEKIRDVMNMIPQDLKLLQEKYIEVEALHWLHLIECAEDQKQCLSAKGTHRRKVYQTTMELERALYSGWPAKIQEKVKNCSSRFEALKLFLS